MPHSDSTEGDRQIWDYLNSAHWQRLNSFRSVSRGGMIEIIQDPSLIIKQGHHSMISSDICKTSMWSICTVISCENTQVGEHTVEKTNQCKLSSSSILFVQLSQK